MRSVTIEKEVVVREERTLEIPKITGFCELNNSDADEVCDCLQIACGGSDCDDCLFSKQNFEYFKAFMNDEKTV